MMRYAQYAVYCLALFLVACGFHLKGLAQSDTLPYSRWQVVDGGALTEDIHRELLRYPQVKLTDKHAAALQVTDISQQKDIQSINRSGSVGEYILVLRVEAQILFEGKVLADNLSVVVRRDYAYADDEIYGKQEEEAHLWQAMYRDAAEQLVRRVAALPQQEKL